MKNLIEVDKNFIVNNHIDNNNIKFYNADEKLFRIYGVYRENGKYRRMPEKISSNVSEGVYHLHANTAGGRVRFCTNSSFVAIRADMDGILPKPHFAFTGSSGFDLYVGNDYIKTFVPPINMENGYESIVEFKSNEYREITINFPLYSNVNQLQIGLEINADLKDAKPYKNEKPVVYYGSSITHGGCASRPGMAYQSIISRKFDCDFVNLGFAGNAKAEDVMIDYIKNLKMSVFVYDYDHNAPSVEHLEKTHEKMFKAIRSNHPNIPIVIMSRPKYNLTDEEKQRFSIIEKTYNNAISSGDKNVYLISGKMLTQLCKGEGTVDGTHPTDFGFYSMAEALSDIFDKIEFS